MRGWPGIDVQRIDAELPLFRIRKAGREVYYTPGHVAFSPRALANTARCILGLWQERAVQLKPPECLTVNISNRCTLACTYCYSKAFRSTGALLGEQTVAEAARRVVKACARAGIPFHLVVHGGGEPTVHWGMLGRIVSLTRELAAEHGIDWFGYIATNGILDTDRAAWLARTFDLIGLSCDGPPEIQNRLRPTVGGSPSSAAVAATARAIQGAGGRLTLRSTITPQTMTFQREIVRWLCDHLNATDIRFEPVYNSEWGNGSAFRLTDADTFAVHFLAAQREARGRAVSLGFSGVRLDELHGPYCNAPRGIVQLLPTGVQASCPWQTGMPPVLGYVPPRCQDCVNVFHCSRECPERCEPTSEPGFRCRLQRLLAEAWILQAAEMTTPPSYPP